MHYLVSPPKILFRARPQITRPRRVPWQNISIKPRSLLVKGPSEREAIGQSVRWQSSVAEATRSLKPEARITSTTPPQPTQPLYRRIPIAIALTILAFSAGFAMTAAPAVPTAQALLDPPTDAETLTDVLFQPYDEEAATIEKEIFENPLTKTLLADERYIPSRPHLKIPPKMRAQNLVAGSLTGSDKIAVPPLQFSTADGSDYVSLQFLGPALCGHPGIVHGGLLATLLDEGSARCCFPALPNKVAVTAYLNIQYKKPAMAGQIFVLRARTTRVEGRKAWVHATMETLPVNGEERGMICAEAESLFIEPKTLPPKFVVP